MKIIRNSYGWPVTSYNMREILGLGAMGKLPVEGMDARIVQGVKVWVTPLVGVARRKRSTHRVLCECPECGMHLSVGRLHQHRCPTVKRPLAHEAGTPEYVTRVDGQLHGGE